jgi:hypothetical protein
MTLQEELVLWKNNSDANDEIDILVDVFNDGVINPEVNPTVKTSALQCILIIENDRDAYVARRIERIESSMIEEARFKAIDIMLEKEFSIKRNITKEQ